MAASIKGGVMTKPSLATLLWLSVFVVDVFKDVPLTSHNQRLPGHTYKRPTRRNSSYQVFKAQMTEAKRPHTGIELIKATGLIGTGLTSDPERPYGVLIESKALLQRMSSHVFIEDITSSEVEDSTVVLIIGDQPWGHKERTVNDQERHFDCFCIISNCTVLSQFRIVVGINNV